MTLLRYLQFLQIGLFTVLQIGEGRGFLLDRSQEKQSHKDIVKTPGANGSEHPPPFERDFQKNVIKQINEYINIQVILHKFTNNELST